MTTRDWLRQNGYEDVVELLDEVMATLAARGSKERRNWWDILAGGKDGRPSVVAGREFPVLRVAQARQGKPITPNAICRNGIVKLTLSERTYRIELASFALVRRHTLPPARR